MHTALAEVLAENKDGTVRDRLMINLIVTISRAMKVLKEAGKIILENKLLILPELDQRIDKMLARASKGRVIVNMQLWSTSNHADSSILKQALNLLLKKMFPGI